LVMWAHDIDQPAFVARLRGIDDDIDSVDHAPGED
jgi:hypothetical protein